MTAEAKNTVSGDGFFNAALKKLLNVGGTACDVALIILMLIISFDVIMRYVFRQPTLWSFEVTEYCLLFLVFMSMAYVQQTNSHLKVELVFGLLPTRAKNFISLGTAILSLIACIIITVHGWNIAMNSYELNQVSNTLQVPLFIPKLLIPFGGVLMCIEFIIRIGKISRSLMGKTA